ncbi:hypothetical protein THMIRHAS_09860 [Thiosulfatimonas sediminis]|uniref:Bacterial Ig-like domain-containing protein n=1 Tax=Thiosulfatimonas sediminis TaxID=2675054 RepID=A0A6F8PTZ6_9GAMM|nr:Ig-like domain-containing protein [Thiosulfatimonas sediminis]BBP45613.1 hypothetical protein THMIRHAS_09860 [Thiosulfatimonas sediminis]
MKIASNQTIVIPNSNLAGQAQSFDNAVQAQTLNDVLGLLNQEGDILENLEETAAGAADNGGATTLTLYSISESQDEQYQEEGGVPQVSRIVETTDPVTLDDETTVTAEAQQANEGVATETLPIQEEPVPEEPVPEEPVPEEPVPEEPVPEEPVPEEPVPEEPVPEEPVPADTQGPSLEITEQDGTVTFQFSEAVKDFTQDDVQITGGSLSDFTQVDGDTWTATFTPDASFEGTAQISVADNTYTDLSDNNGTGAQLELGVDTQGPSLEITEQDGTVTFQFSEAVKDFTQDDVQITGGSLSDFTQVDGDTWTATFTPDASFEGTAQISVADNTYTDLSDNNGTGAQLELGVDTQGPSLEITEQDGTVTFQFSEAVKDFTQDDVQITGGSLSDFTQVDGDTWTATFTPDASFEGTAQISVADNTYTDLSDNNGTGAQLELGVDTQGPSLEITEQDGTVTFQFSEAVKDFTQDDVQITGGSLSDFTQVDGDTWTATFTPDANFEGTAQISVADNTYTDLSDNNGTGAQLELGVDTQGPSLEITEQDGTVTFQFSEAVKDFTQDDVQITGGSLSDFTQVDGDTWTATFTPDASFEGTAQISVADNTYTDLSDNNGTGDELNLPISENKTPYIKVDNDSYPDNQPGIDEVFESGLALGSLVGQKPVVAVGEIRLFDADGLGDLTEIRFGGEAGTLVSMTQLEALALGNMASISIADAGLTYGSLSITAYDSTTGVIAYEYTLNTAVENSQESDDFSESFSIEVADQKGWSDSVQASIKIIDDKPEIDPEAFDVSGSYDLNALFGADGAGTIVFSADLHAQAVTDKDGQPVYFNGSALKWNLVDGVLTAVSEAGDTAITVTLNPTDNNYTIEIADGVFGLTPANNLLGVESFTGGNSGFFGLFNNLLGILATSLDGTVNTNQGYVGVADQWIDQGETLTLSFFDGMVKPADIKPNDLVLGDILGESSFAGVSAFSALIDFQGNSTGNEVIELLLTMIDGSQVTYMANVIDGAIEVVASKLPVVAVNFIGCDDFDYRVGALSVVETQPEEVNLAIPVTIEDGDQDVVDALIEGTIPSQVTPVISNDPPQVFIEGSGGLFGLLGIEFNPLIDLGFEQKLAVYDSADNITQVEISYSSLASFNFNAIFGNPGQPFYLDTSESGLTVTVESSSGMLGMINTSYKVTITKPGGDGVNQSMTNAELNELLATFQVNNSNTFFAADLMSNLSIRAVDANGDADSESLSQLISVESNLLSAVTKKSVFADDIVEGLAFETNSGIKGLTDENGAFSYRDGDSVAFKIGDVLIGVASAEDLAAGYVFLQDLADVSRSDLNSEYVENMAVFLQTLDANANPADGILITPEVHQQLAGQSIDLATASEQELQQFLLDNGFENIVTEVDAMAHVQATLMNLTDMTAAAFDLHIPDSELALISQGFDYANIDIATPPADFIESMALEDMSIFDVVQNDFTEVVFDYLESADDQEEQNELDSLDSVKIFSKTTFGRNETMEEVIQSHLDDTTNL